MTVSSRTPEGEPLRCDICGRTAAIETSFPDGDACCPSCGSLVWQVRDRVVGASGIDDERFSLAATFEELGADSLDVVELVMELEEEFDVAIPDDAAERIKTIGDVVRYIHDLKSRSK